MKIRNSMGTALAAAVGVLALTAGTASAAAPALQHTTATTAVAKTATHLSLKTSSANAKAGAWVTLTVHLDKHGTNRTVTLLGQDWGGGKPFVVHTGAVDKHGNLVVRYHSYQNHTFWATFAGGAAYAASTSPKVVVRAYAAVTAGSSGFYSSYKSGGHVVHKVHAKSALLIRGAVVPNKANANFTMYAQVFYKGKWISANTPHVFQLDAKSQYGVTFTNWPKGYTFRAAASFRGDARDHAGTAAWTYWTVTA